MQRANCPQSLVMNSVDTELRTNRKCSISIWLEAMMFHVSEQHWAIGHLARGILSASSSSMREMRKYFADWQQPHQFRYTWSEGIFVTPSLNPSPRSAHICPNRALQLKTNVWREMAPSILTLTFAVIRADPSASWISNPDLATVFPFNLDLALPARNF